MKIKEFSLVLPFFPDDNILLGEHMRGPGKGKRNGFGGKREEEDATMEDTAIRELGGESGIRILRQLLKLIGVFDCVRDARQEIRRVFVYRIDYAGEYEETEEMKPKLFKILNIPYHQMREADKIWLKRYLDDKEYFEWTFRYDENDNLIREPSKGLQKIE